MSLTDEFKSHYSREYGYYYQVARLCAQRCETELETSGIRAIVTFRAKQPKSG